MESIELSPWLVGYTAICLTLMVVLVFVNTRKPVNEQNTFEEDDHFIELAGYSSKTEERFKQFDQGHKDCIRGLTPQSTDPDYEAGYGQAYAEAEARTALTGGF